MRRLPTLDSLLLPVLLACLSGLLLPGCATPPARATLVLRGGPLRSLDPQCDGASAVALVDGRIAWVGDAADAAPWIGPATEVVELAGRAVLPGFADAHLHLSGLADLLVEVDLVGTRSFAEVVQRVAARAAELPDGTWVMGRGWDQNDWPDTQLPHHAALSEAIPRHPVVLTRIDGHALLANRAALDAAGVGTASVAPDGGRIHFDDSGEPTGVLVDNAMGLVRSLLPEAPRAERRRRLAVAIAHLHAHGITSVHDAGIDADTVRLFAEMARAGELPLRVHAMLRADDPELRRPRVDSGWPSADLTGQGLLAVRAIKAMADGALGSRGAALLRPYADEPGQRGLVLADHEGVAELASFALAHGWQLCTHAIGDRANRIVLDAYEQALTARPTNDHRFRVEHAQIIDPADIPRFAQLGVTPSMQAQHQTSDMPWAGERLGEERLAGAYAWRALLDTGVTIPGGSDAPVEVLDVPAALHAAATRQDADDQPPGGWHAEQCMTRAEALAHVTLWPAWAAFHEDDLGSITPGKRADLVVLSADPLTVPASDLDDLVVELTVFDGQVVYRRDAAP